MNSILSLQKKMREAFSYIPEACDNTLKIADKCNVELTWTDEKETKFIIYQTTPLIQGRL